MNCDAELCIAQDKELSPKWIIYIFSFNIFLLNTFFMNGREWNSKGKCVPYWPQEKEF